MLRKLRLKFVLITMVIVAAMLMTIFVTVYHFTKSDLNRQSDAMLRELTQSVQKTGSLPRPNREVSLPYFVISIYLNGEVQFVGYTSYDLSDETLLQELIQKVYRADKKSGELPEYDLLFSTVGGMGTQRIVFLDVSSHRDTLSSLIQICLLIGIGGILVFLVISILLARWAVKPVQTAWDQQKQFISDASHELKTPLTVIMSNAELLQTEPENKGQLTQSIVTMSHRMRSLVEGMLELARSDNKQTKMQTEKLNLSRLIETAVLPFEPVLFENGLLLETQIEPEIMVSGSTEHLQRVVGVFLDNAAKYASPGTVTVALKRSGADNCVFTVANPGVPIGKEQQSKIFDRFYRGDAARTEGGSFGLGLPIAKTIVENHKGKIWVQSNSTGNCFSVQLPTA